MVLKKKEMITIIITIIIPVVVVVRNADEGTICPVTRGEVILSQVSRRSLFRQHFFPIKILRWAAAATTRIPRWAAAATTRIPRCARRCCAATAGFFATEIAPSSFFLIIVIKLRPHLKRVVKMRNSLLRVAVQAVHPPPN